MTSSRTSTITIRGTEVTLDWSAKDHTRAGVATHTVSQAEMDEGCQSGPWDGETFRHGGREYRLGQHDYETSAGNVTCWANIYPIA